MHFNGSDSNTELLIRIILSDNQVSIYGAVADLCEELSKDSGSTGKPVAHENLDSMVTRTEALIAHSNDQTNVVQRKLFVECDFLNKRN